jgi:PiT family inorganic phosphate transporter
VGLAALMNLIGAFLSIKVATTIATGIVDAKALTLTMVFAALIGAIKGDTLVEKVIVPAVLSPVIAGLVAIAGTIFAYAMVARLREGEARRGYRLGQIGSASLVSLAHGTNDAQKTMGSITLALIAHGNLDADNFTVPLWVKIGCGVAIAAGTYVGGWRIINTMGNRLTEIEAPQVAAESSGASVILASSYSGYPLSTTHVVSGAVVGSGVGKRLASVRWGTAGQMASAWLLTIPGAAIIGAAAFEGADLFGQGNAGPVIVGLIAAGLAAVLYVVTQRTPVRANDLDRSPAAAQAQSRTRVPVAA